MIIEVNGISYQKRQQTPTPMNKTLLSIILMAGALGVNGSSKPKESPKVDLIKEFELIQQKKSNLSKSQRDWVEWKFNRIFKPITL